MSIDAVTTSAYRFPTPEPESDGTLTWDATVAVVVQVSAEGHTGLGWSYSTAAAAGVVEQHLAGVVCGRDPDDVPGSWDTMHRAVRNLGSRGLVMDALSAVDIALWDLKARVHDLPLARLLGRVRTGVPVYGSGGFTSMDAEQLRAQVDGWRAAGCSAMKIKIGQSWGNDTARDLARVRQLRQFAGPDAALMVDANGGYRRGLARRIGNALDELGVVWFEEPVSSDDTVGLGAVRDAVVCDVAAGEYAADVYEAARLCPVVDCLQLDVTRCGGYTGWQRCAAVAAAHNLDVSGHCAPSLHAVIGAAVPNVRHVEWFADHARLEPMLIDGVPTVRDGLLSVPDGVPGHGMTLRAQAAQYRIG